MMKKILIGIIAIILSTSVFGTQWVTDHNNCDVVYQSQDCTPDKSCGYTGGTLYCSDSGTINAAIPGTTDTVSSTSYSGGLGGGYVLDCQRNAASCLPWVCQRDSVCYTTRNKQTTCLGSVAAGGGEGVSFNCGACIANHYDCDSDGITCEIGDGDSCGTNGVYSGCDAPNGNCVCAAGYNDCDGTGADSGNGCEIQDGAACTLNGAEGTYSGCSGSIGQCVPSKSYFETGTLSTYLTNETLLWGKNLGSGFLMNLSNGTGLEFKIDNDACIVFRDGSTQCSSSGSGSGTGEAAGWSSDGTTTNTSINVKMGNNDFYYNSTSGYIGLGSTTPRSKLDMGPGDITFSKEGSIMWNVDVNEIRFDDFPSWYGYASNVMTFETLASGSDDSGVFVFRGTNPGNAMVIEAGVTRVGIGVDDPNSTLHVGGDINVTSGNDICIDGGNCLSSVLDGVDVSVGAGWFNNSDTTNTLLNVNVSNGKLFVNVTSGYVGIGTTSPGRIFHVESSSANSQFTSTASADAAIYLSGTSSSSLDNQGITSQGDNIGIMAGGFTRLTVNSSGNVGIGTNTPGSKLEVVGSGAGNSAMINILRTGDTVGAGTFVNPNGAGSIVLSNNSDEIGVYIQGGGDTYFLNNFGLGTTTPLYDLDVAGGMRIGDTTLANEGAIRYRSNSFEGYNGTGWVTMSGGSGSTLWKLNNSDAYYKDGNVGIGTSNPTEKLHIKGDDTNNDDATLKIESGGSGETAMIRLNESTSGSEWTIAGPDANDALSFRINSSLTAAMTPNGVGIGTNAPSHELAVIGSANVTQNISVGEAIEDREGSPRILIKDTVIEINLQD